MAYAQSGLSLAWQLLGGKYSTWVYQTTDTFVGTVDQSDYFAGAGLIAGGPGMRLYDVVVIEKTDTASVVWGYVSNVAATTFNVTVTAMAFAGAGSFTTLAASGVFTPTGGIAAAGGFSMSPRGFHTGQHAAYVSTDGNNSTPSITETYVSEIFVPTNCTITGIAVFNGSDVTGNMTVGLATSAGAPIAAAKSASTAGSGTDAYQLVPFATPYAALGPAKYHIQVQYSSATARYNTHTLGTHGVLVQTAQTYGTLASFTPPTTFVTNVGNICGLY